ncbi:hypothetical protein BT93_G1207 [Corymbia citriodora subsp. variegata]|nr:hypothetical protein BT93_G1207 [Corymbia citriodora subsp. variegata]
MASYIYTSFMPTLLFALFVIQALELSHSKTFTNVSCIGSEREALLKFKQDLIDPSRRLWSWTSEDCCKWDGVECHKKTGHVLKLDLHNPCGGLECSLGGKVHHALNKLKHLKYLDLSFNNFSAQKIPESLASLQKLEYLNLSSAGFYGQISNEVSNLSSLRYLDVSNYRSLSSITIENLRWLSTFSNLKYLDLSYVPLLNPKDWLSPINMLSSLEFLILRGCDLEDASGSPHVNFTYLRFLDLSYNFMNSPIPPWFQNLSKLEHLDLTSNGLRGIFPTTILANSPSFRFLKVSGNGLEGELLKNMSIFCNLQVLNLHSNNFSGRISSREDSALICGHSNLKTIDVFNNNFSGQLPSQFGNFKDLEFLDFSCNSISGSIPATVGELSSLRKLHLFSNKLSGNLPESIGQLSNLEEMDIRHNQLEGVVSELHFANLTSLTVLYFYSNELVLNISTSWVPSFQLQKIFMPSCKVGPRFPYWLRTQRNISILDMSNASILDEVPNRLPDVLSNIERLDLSGNILRGNISQIIGKNIPFLKVMLLSRNKLSGSIPNSLCMSNELGVLNLSKNLLSGRLPQCWRKSQANLEWISLGDNKLNGQIPYSLCHLKHLGVLGLHNNSLNGVLPKCLLKLDLAYLDLSDNQFTGIIPSFGRHSQSFKIIDLERNYFTGDIPLQLCHLDNLQYLSLAHNNLSGGIPHCFNNFSLMWANSTFTPYKIGFPIKDGFGRTIKDLPIMVDMKKTIREFTSTIPYSIDLSSNALEGQIPKGLTRLAQLQNLNLSHNKLIGEIPEDIGNLRGLESLDLSKNKLSGGIPPSISNLDFLSCLDLSFNNLSGRVPSSNHLTTLEDQFFYRGNDGLCGAPLLKVCPGEDHNDKDGRDDHDAIRDKSNGGDSITVHFYSGLGPGFTVAILGFCGMLHLKQSWRITYFRAVDRIIMKLSILWTITVIWFKRVFQF